MSAATITKPAKDKSRKPVKARFQKLLDHLNRPAIYDFPLKASTVAAPFMVGPDGVHGVFVLGSPSWEFDTLDQRIITWDQIRSRLGQLTESVDRPGGRPFHWRPTFEPFPAVEYAARYDAATVAPLPHVEGAETWNEYLAHVQRRLLSNGLDQKLAVIAVWLGPVPSPECVDDLAGGVEHPRREAVKVLNEFAEVAEILSGPGLLARPATSADVALVMHRSLSMGVPPPAHVGGEKRWDAHSMGEFTGRSTWLVSPISRSVEIVSEAAGSPVTRHVAVLSLGEMPDITWPESGADPWLLAASRLGFPVEISMSGVLLRGRQVEPKAVFEQRRAGNVAKDYAEHDLEMPPAVGRAIERARDTLDEVTDGTARETARFFGTVRLAVTGATEDEVNDRARKVVAEYADLRIPVTRTKDQGRVLREFTLLEPRVKDGFERRMSTGYLAAAAPHIDPVVGTPDGPYTGYTSLARRAVLCNLHYGIEKLNRPGMFPIAGEPGSGKSVALGALTYVHVRAGGVATLLDPSNSLAEALLSMREIAPFTRRVGLTDDGAEDGTLSPPQMLPSPSAEEFRDSNGKVDEDALSDAIRDVHPERNELTFDILRQLVSPELAGAQGATRRLQAAVRSMALHKRAAGVPEQLWNPRWVLDDLKDGDGLAQELYHELNDVSEGARGRLIIPRHDRPIEHDAPDGAPLTVITMAGLEPPPADVDPKYWGPRERQAQPLMHLAAFLAARMIYTGDRDTRKLLGLDEAHWLARSPSGRAGAHRWSRDSRKRNTAILLGSQDPQDHLAIGKLTALIGGVFMGRLRDYEAALRGCETLNVEPEYAAVLQSLEPGEFVYRDPLDRTALMRFDMDYLPSLAALATTPGQERPEYDGTLPPAPFLDPRLMDRITKNQRLITERLVAA